jgi:hypothetical protein
MAFNIKTTELKKLYLSAELPDTEEIISAVTKNASDI